jgi:hypothetical protein
MRRDEAEKQCHGFSNDTRTVLDTAVSAVTQGAGPVRLDPPATEAVHEQFLPKVRSALEQADWQDAWQREQVYLHAYAREMGGRAAMLAAEERRTVVTRQDIEAAAVKMRGYMPIASRWCP